VNRHDQAYAALSTVVDPELDEPITELGFVRSLVVTGDCLHPFVRQTSHTSWRLMPKTFW
jgi:metal-sulfur cluster biosynthetic enzyme